MYGEHVLINLGERWSWGVMTPAGDVIDDTGKRHPAESVKAIYGGNMLSEIAAINSFEPRRTGLMLEMMFSVQEGMKRKGH